VISGMTRRGFLKNAGIAAAGKALHGSLPGIDREAGAAAPGDVRVSGPDAVAVALQVNGREKLVQLEPRITLAQALRVHLGMTGTKVACDHGACSSCTILLDGIAVNSCMMLAVDVGRRSVETIEGLAQNGMLHPLQAAFVKHDAIQCGYCTPGMIMSCAALLRSKATPSREDVRDAISGNLCRCGTYTRVCEATLDAASMVSARNARGA
jgi:aerobic-type carbon monoxide dehydrogenase small subunit (CoxS/CutS family)